MEKSQEKTDGTKWSEKFKVSEEKLPSEINYWKTNFSNLTFHVSGLTDAMKSMNYEKFHTEIFSSISGLKIDEKTTFSKPGIDIANVTLSDLYKACAAASFSIYFHEGKLAITKDGEDDIVEIPAVVLHGETIQVTSNAEKDVTIEAMTRILVVLFECAGLKLTWNKLKKRVIAHSWKVGVKVDLGFPIFNLLSNKMRKAISETFPSVVSSGKTKPELLDYFGDIHSDGFNGNIQIDSKFCAIDLDLDFNIRIINAVSGISDPIELNFRRQLSSERGSNLIYIIASTDTDTLRKLLSKIVKGINNE